MQLATFLSEIRIVLYYESINFTVWFSHLCLHKEPPQSLVCTQKKGFFLPLRLPQRSRNQGKVGQKIEKWTLYYTILLYCGGDCCNINRNLWPLSWAKVWKTLDELSLGTKEKMSLSSYYATMGTKSFWELKLVHVVWRLSSMDKMTKEWYFFKLHFQFSGPWDAHRIKIWVDLDLWQVSRSCSIFKS